MSSDDLVINFNQVFGILPEHDIEPSLDLLKTPAFDQAWALVEEEFRETQEAVAKIRSCKSPTNEMYKELIDGLGDVEVTLLGFAYRMGIDMKKTRLLIYENNMSKLCSSEKEAEETVEWYKSHPEKGYPSPSYRKGMDEKWIVYETTTNKILKSVLWKEVDLTPVIYKRMSCSQR